MTKSEILAALANLPDDTPIVLDVGIDTFLDVRVLTDEGGVRVVPADDEEGAEFVATVRAAFA